MATFNRSCINSDSTENVSGNVQPNKCTFQNGYTTCLSDILGHLSCLTEALNYTKDVIKKIPLDSKHSHALQNDGCISCDSSSPNQIRSHENVEDFQNSIGKNLCSLNKSSSNNSIEARKSKSATLQSSALKIPEDISMAESKGSSEEQSSGTIIENNSEDLGNRDKFQYNERVTWENNLQKKTKESSFSISKKSESLGNTSIVEFSSVNYNEVKNIMPKQGKSSHNKEKTVGSRNETLFLGSETNRNIPTETTLETVEKNSASKKSALDCANHTECRQSIKRALEVDNDEVNQPLSKTTRLSFSIGELNEQKENKSTENISKECENVFDDKESVRKTLGNLDEIDLTRESEENHTLLSFESSGYLASDDKLDTEEDNTAINCSHNSENFGYIIDADTYTSTADENSLTISQCEDKDVDVVGNDSCELSSANETINSEREFEMLEEEINGEQQKIDQSNISNGEPQNANVFKIFKQSTLGEESSPVTYSTPTMSLFSSKSVFPISEDYTKYQSPLRMEPPLAITNCSKSTPECNEPKFVHVSTPFPHMDLGKAYQIKEHRDVYDQQSGE